MGFYITGDTHGEFSRFQWFTDLCHPGPEDTMIVLGDAGLNYFRDWRDKQVKAYVNGFGFTTFCIHGNHEERPQNIPSYKTKEYCGGQVMYEEAYPNILFAVDGEVYDFNGLSCLVIGGAYSVDKDRRIAQGFGWFASEQPTDAIKRRVEEQVQKYKHVDIVLTHTCPYRYEPVEMFLPEIDQSQVDNSTEKWLDTIESMLNYDKWYCGHFHTSKKIDRMQFMFKDVEALQKTMQEK